MDYESQSRKDNPFEGLSDDEKRHLFVYLCYVAHPSLTPEEIEKRWGRVLEDDKVPTVFEALEIAKTMKQKVAPQDSQAKVPTPRKEASAWKTFAWILLPWVWLLLSLLALAMRCARRRYANRKRCANRKNNYKKKLSYDRKLHN